MKKERVIKVMCQNCHYEEYRLCNESGQASLQCPCCGAKTVNSIISRRHMQIDVYAPKGQVIIIN